VTKYKTLTVKQPWAWGLIHGPKRIENRGWECHHRGPLLIHAGKSRSYFSDADDLDAAMLAFREELGADLPAPDQLDYGVILGIVDVVDCLRLNVALRRYVDAGHPDQRPFAEGPYCIITANPQPLKRPVPYRGAQGLFDVPAHLVEVP